MMIPVIVSVVAGAVVLVAVLAVLGAGRIAGRLAGARHPTATEAERLDVYVEALCLGAGLPVPRLAVIDDEACGALAYGLSPRRGTAAVTTGLLATLSPAEIEGALAHLLVRIADGTARRGTYLCAPALLAGPVGAVLVARYLDGARIVTVDVGAARLTRFPPGLVGALERMGNGSGTPTRRPTAIRHLWMHEAPGPRGRGVSIEDRVTVLSDL